MTAEGHKRQSGRSPHQIRPTIQIGQVGGQQAGDLPLAGVRHQRGRHPGQKAAVQRLLQQLIVGSGGDDAGDAGKEFVDVGAVLGRPNEADQVGELAQGDAQRSAGAVLLDLPVEDVDDAAEVGFVGLGRWGD